MSKIARFEMPDGRVARFEVPDAFTPEQAQQAMQSQMQQARPSDVERQRLEMLEQVPEIGQGGLLAEEPASTRGTIAAALLTTTDPQEMGQILTAQVPYIGVVQTPEGRLIARNNRTGAVAELNKPGLSQIDVLQTLGLMSAFTPSGAGIAGIGARQLGTLGIRSAATQAAIEAGQAAVGGEVDVEDVALAGALAPVGQVVGEKVLSPLARAVGGRASEGMKSLIKKAKDQNIDILTTDVLPPGSFIGRSLQQMSEKLGVLGTGQRRVAQQKARVEVVEGLAQEMGLSVDTPVHQGIFKSLSRGVGRQLERGGVLRREAVDSLAAMGDVPVDKTLKAVDDQIAKQAKLKELADPQIVDYLNRFKSSIQNNTFEDAVSLRSGLIDDVNAAFKGEALPSKAAGQLQAVKKAVDQDLLDFATKSNRDAAAKWIKSNRIFADGYRKAKDTEVKRMLNRGEGTPEVVASVLKGGKTSELRRLSSLLDDKGRESAKLAIIKDALEESRFFQTGEANPDAFVTAISKAPRQRAIQALFTKTDRKQIDGIRKVLEATRRAQAAPVSTPTGQQLVPIALTGGLVADAGTTLATGGAIGAITRAYESAGMRNLLIRLANTPKGSPAEQRILSQVLPFFQAAAQAGREPILEETQNAIR